MPSWHEEGNRHGSVIARTLATPCMLWDAGRSGARASRRRSIFWGLHTTRKDGAGFQLGRQTQRKRLKAKLREIKETLRRHRHTPIDEQGRWLGAMMKGHFAYFAVPNNVCWPFAEAQKVRVNHCPRFGRCPAKARRRSAEKLFLASAKAGAQPVEGASECPRSPWGPFGR
jgi:hypothetical protein